MPQPTTTQRFFTGEFDHTVDSVNRLVIPSKWRTGESEELYLFARDEGRVAVLPHPQVQKIIQQINESTDLSPNDRRIQLQRIFSSAVQATCDKQGRITLEAKLLKHAGLKDRVILVGGGERFEIWNPGTWERLRPETNAGSVNAMERFGI